MSQQSLSYWLSSFQLERLESKGLNKGTFSGYASTYSLDQNDDQIMPGAFSRSLAQWRQTRKRFPHLYWEHDFEEVIGVCQSLKEDAKGLKIRGKLLMDIPLAEKAYTHLQKGLNGLSIGFYPTRTLTTQGVRYIHELVLKEISLVENPCNPEARIHEHKSNTDYMPHLKKLFHTLTS
jgi:HK97 family phage prohead protease